MCRDPTRFPLFAEALDASNEYKLRAPMALVLRWRMVADDGAHTDYMYISSGDVRIPLPDVKKLGFGLFISKSGRRPRRQEQDRTPSISQR